MLAGCGGTRRLSSEKEISVWHPWGGDDLKNLRRVVRRYETAHPGRKVRLVFTGNDLSANQKFFTAVAAGKPPDVCYVDGQQVAQWAQWGAIEPLDREMADAGLRQDDFYAPCWRQCFYRGSVWSLTYCADPNFAWCWNRRVFREAGLDPERPPRTISELDAMARSLETQRNGRIERLGVIPWGQYGLSNSLFTWGWAWGGSFYDDASARVTANHPRIEEALAWMVGYADRLGITRVSAATSAWGTGAMDAFITGQLAMTCSHISTVKVRRQYAPDLDYGMAPLPGMPDGEIGSSWVGGWTLAVPRGCRNRELAWDFIRWICATPEGTAAVVEETGNLPGFRKSPGIDVVRRNPRLRIFADILDTSRHQRPVMPAEAFLMGALDRAVSRALYGRQTPKQALDQATEETQTELDLALGRRRM